MIIHNFGDVNGIGLYGSTAGTPRTQPIPDGDYRAVAIGPGSTVDLCTVNGQPLAAGRLLVVPPGPIAIGPLRSVATIDDRAENAQVCSNLQLALYGCGDPLVPIGPRAPSRVYAKDTANANAWTRFLRLPFQGRSWAKFVVRNLTDPGDGSSDDFAIIGVNYIDRGRLAALLAAGSSSVAALTLLHQDVCFYSDAALTAIEALGTGAAGYVTYIGGTDTGEVFDELWLYAKASEDIEMYAEAYDRSTVGGV